ncbi:MAG TPA: deoxynucleoside kinase [Solirubrobacteraceae bacterium]|nr:deoxynucleoside kinase [Solirubrobacteraceae bacterium]
MSGAPLIGLSGLVGAGKSTVVTPLASRLGFRAWPERVFDNPFFPRFVQDRAAWAFHSQTAFLIGATEDAVMARREGVGGVIERPPQEMLGVFARTLQDEHLLGRDEVCLLTRIVAFGERLGGVPDLLVALQAAPETLLARIRARRSTDTNLYSLGDLKRLAVVYDRWISDWDRSPVLEVDVEVRDLRDPSEVTRLAAEVREALNGRRSTH